MNHHNWQNSSQVYTQSHKHFYRWMTYPTLFLFLFILSFLFLGKKEMIIKSQGQLTSTIVSKIQIPIEGKVLENKLSENLAVKKGETLVKLDLESFKKNKEALEQEIPLIENQIKSAETFIESLNKGTSQFTSDDEFGYKNQLESLLAENSANDASLNQSIETHKNEQATYENTKKSIALSIYKKKEERRNWQDIRSAWTSQSNITNFPTEITAQYTTFQNQLKTSSKEEKEQVKGGIIIPDSAKEKSQEATVVAVGLGRTLDDGKRSSFDVKVGDRVLISKYGGTEVTLNGEKYMLLREDDIVAILK